MTAARDGVEALERRRENAGRLEEDGELARAQPEPGGQEVGLGERLAAGDGERDERRRRGDERLNLGLELTRGEGVRAPPLPVGTEDAAFGDGEEALGSVAVAAAKRAAPQTHEEMSPPRVQALTLERDEYLRDVPPATPHAAAI